MCLVHRFPDEVFSNGGVQYLRQLHTNLHADASIGIGMKYPGRAMEFTLLSLVHFGRSCRYNYRMQHSV